MGCVIGEFMRGLVSGWTKSGLHNLEKSVLPFHMETSSSPYLCFSLSVSLRLSCNGEVFLCDTNNDMMTVGSLRTCLYLKLAWAGKSSLSASTSENSKEELDIALLEPHAHFWGHFLCLVNTLKDPTWAMCSSLWLTVGLGQKTKTSLTHRCSELLLDGWINEWINEMNFGFPQPLLCFSQFMFAFVLFTLFEGRDSCHLPG